MYVYYTPFIPLPIHMCIYKHKCAYLLYILESVYVFSDAITEYYIYIYLKHNLKNL